MFKEIWFFPPLLTQFSIFKYLVVTKFHFLKDFLIEIREKFRQVFKKMGFSEKRIWIKNKKKFIDSDLSELTFGRKTKNSFGRIKYLNSRAQWEGSVVSSQDF